MRVDERVILGAQMLRYMALHRGIRVEAICKESEELRSGFVVAAMTSSRFMLQPES